MKVALYARVSKKGDQTTENQMLKLEEFAKLREYEVFDKYEDEVSGANKNRPNLDRMLADAKFRKFDKIIATKIDRLGRSVIHLHEFFKEIDGYGISIELTDQPIDTASPMGKFTITILGGVAELERELIKERTIDGLERTVRNGTKLGRSVKTLSPERIEKIKNILTENPNISNRQLADQFKGISRNTLIKLAKAEGLIP